MARGEQGHQDATSTEAEYGASPNSGRKWVRGANGSGGSTTLVLCTVHREAPKKVHTLEQNVAGIRQRRQLLLKAAHAGSDRHPGCTVWAAGGRPPAAGRAGLAARREVGGGSGGGAAACGSPAMPSMIDTAAFATC